MSHSPPPAVCFGPFVLDRVNECLRRDGDEIPLRPKAFLLLDYLIQHAGRLVTKNELLDEVWSDSPAGDAVLKVCVNELRRCLGDSAKDARYIATIHRRGYRFLEVPTPEVVESPSESPVERLPAVGGPPTRSRSLPTETPPGRQASMAQLQHALMRVREEGTRQIVFVSAEAGLGKTTLLDAFFASLGADTDVATSVGQCLPSGGESEAYHPFLEAMGRLAREREEVRHALKAVAPTWFVQFPWLMNDEHARTLRQEVLGATRERMLREMAECLESITTSAPLVLALEDLHWADQASLDLLALLARRREASPLLILATYRPHELILREHALRDVKGDLIGRGLASDVRLELLSRNDIQAWLDVQATGCDDAVVEWLFHRTEGHPLFLVHLFDWLRRTSQERDVEAPLALPDEGSTTVPESLRHVIEAQVRQLDETSHTLVQAAALAGSTFSAAAVAAALDISSEEVDEALDHLAPRQPLVRYHDLHTLPDGTRTVRYQFSHTLVQDVVAQEVPPARAARIQRRLGENAERVYGDGSRADVGTAAGIGRHFELAGDLERAVRWMRRAARTSHRLCAHREAARLLTRAYELTQELGDEGLRRRLGCDVLIDLGGVHQGAERMQDAISAFQWASTQAREAEDAVREADALLQCTSAASWVDLSLCRESNLAASDLAAHIESAPDRAHVEASVAYWHLLLSGWRSSDFDASEHVLEVARSLGDDGRLRHHLGRHSWFLILRGDYHAGAIAAREALALSAESGAAFDATLFHFFLGWALMFQADDEEAARVLEQGAAASARNGHRLSAMLFTIQRAWLLAERGDGQEALRLVEPTLDIAEEHDHGFGCVLGSAVEALAAWRSGDVERAHDATNRATQRLTRDDVLMSWIACLPLAEAQARLALDDGREGPAEAHIDHLEQLASPSGERTFWLRAMTLRVQQRVSQKRYADARAEVERALRMADPSGAPRAAADFHRAAVSAFPRDAQRAGEHREAAEWLEARGAG